jgi:hypothetical protein
MALSLIVPGPSLAEDSDLVRVEVLVFQHANGQSDRWPATVNREFSELPDPIARAEDFPVNFEGVSPRSQSANLGPLAPSWPPLYTRTGQNSDLFQSVVERIEASSIYRVLSRVEWIQPLSRNARPQAVRLRGEQELQLDEDDTPPSRFVFGRPLDNEAEPASYQLDGSITVRQRQFRHIDLDLVWQEPEPSSMAAGVLSPVAPNDSEVLIHRLRTSRPINLDRLEYFDSSWLGVIVLVQEWSRSDALPAGGHAAQPQS